MLMFATMAILPCFCHICCQNTPCRHAALRCRYADAAAAKRRFFACFHGYAMLRDVAISLRQAGAYATLLMPYFFADADVVLP